MQAGVDEVGRGCLAGPVVAAAVVLFNEVEGLKDSKQLTPIKRNRLCDEILEFHHKDDFFLWALIALNL